MNRIHVEFFGMARHHAGTQTFDVMTSAESMSLGEVLFRLQNEFPGLLGCVVNDGVLMPGYVASINGECFLRDVRAKVAQGQSLLLLSADAGG